LYFLSSWFQIQGFSFSFPISFVVPVTVTGILSFCGVKAKNTCSFDEVIPGYLFFECPAIGDFFQYIWTEQVTRKWEL
jgi:chitin synthase